MLDFAANEADAALIVAVRAGRRAVSWTHAVGLTEDERGVELVRFLVSPSFDSPSGSFGARAAESALVVVARWQERHQLCFLLECAHTLGDADGTVHLPEQWWFAKRAEAG